MGERPALTCHILDIFDYAELVERKKTQIVHRVNFLFLTAREAVYSKNDI
jgi:hypothetical protein